MTGRRRSIGSKARSWLAACLLCLMVTLIATQAASARELPPPPFPLDSPPQALGKDRGGKEVSLADYSGKVVIVTFWASWCTYCLKELPVLNAFQQQAGEQWLRIVSINVKDDNDDYRAMTRQMKDYALTMTRDRNGKVADVWGVNSYPNLWIIDRRGRVAGRHVGYGEGSFEGIVNDIQKLLRAEQAEPPATAPATAPVEQVSDQNDAEAESSFGKTGLAAR